MDQPKPAAEFEASLAGKGFDFTGLLIAVARGKRTILLCGFILAACVGLVESRIHSRYRATAEVLPPQITRGSTAAAMLSQSGMPPDLASLASVGGFAQAKSQTDIFVELLLAWPIRDQMVKKYNLVSAFHVRDEAAAREALVARTTVEGTKSGFITISVIDTDRQRTAVLANGYIDALREFMRTLALTEASQRRVFYHDQMEKTKANLEQAEEVFKETQQNSHMISLDSQARTLLDQAAGLRSQITAREVELQALKSYSTDTNPQVQIAQSSLEALRGHLAQIETQHSRAGGDDSLSVVPAKELDFVRSTRELKYQENLYDLMVKQYELALMDEARDGPVVQLIQPALTPESKFGPHRVRTTAFAFLAGCLVGLMIVLAPSLLSKVNDERLASFRQIRSALFHW